ncbi:MAG TPA: DUF5916 domain-containing protein [Candidatus Kryptonia bacterium]
MKRRQGSIGGKRLFCRSCFIGFSWLLVTTFTASAFAYESMNRDKFHVSAVKIERNIDLTGKLSDPAWKLAPPVEVAYEIQPGENIPARERTNVYVLYNSEYIYFGFSCQDSSAHLIRSHVTDRDKMTDDDFVGVILDTYGQMQSGYEFFSNPQSVQFDAMRTSNNEDASFDAVWYSMGAISDSGYTVEIAVPFKSMRFPSTPDQHWMVEFLRVYPRDSRYLFTWTPIDRNNPCILCQGGTIDGVNGIESSNNLEVLPYAMGVQTGSLNDTGDPNSEYSNGPVIGRFGVGLKYAPSSSFMLGGVFNPDFSQIESDATQISVNNTFAIFYPEKRPFFLEGADLFNTVVSAFYSRMINDPVASAKMTSKAGSFSVAYLVAEDRQSPFIVPGEEGSDFVSTSLKSLSNVVRAKYDFGSESFIGVLGTARNFTNAHNYMGGADWNFLFGGNYYLVGQALYSNTKEINDPSLFTNDRKFGATHFDATFNGEQYDGSGAQIDLKRNARDYSFDLGASTCSPLFQAQDGFVTSTNRKVIQYWNGYTVYPSETIVENASVQSSSGLVFNDLGTRKGVWTELQAQAQLKGQTSIWMGYYPILDEIFHGVSFTKLYHTEVSVNSRPTRGLEFDFWCSVGRFINRADNPELGRGNNFWAELILKPTDKFSVDMTYARSRLWAASSEDLFYDGYIARSAVVYQFSPELFVRLICQYDEFAKQIQIDPMISYKLNPFTVFYAGSDHNFTDFGSPYGVQKTVQQFFVKLQYLWQK